MALGAITRISRARTTPTGYAGLVQRPARVLNLLACLIGGIALAIVLDQLGGEGLRRVFVGTGAWFAVIATIDLASVACDATAIHGFLRGTVSYGRVFAAQASGIAINRLTPGNTLGEPVKVTMLAADVPTNAAVSAILMFNLTTMYVGIASIVLGVPLTLLMLDLPHRAEVAVWIATVVLLAFAVAIAVVVRRGAIATVIGWLARVRIISAARGARWTTAIADIDVRLRDLGSLRSAGVARGVAGVACSRMMNWLGTLGVLHAVGIPLTAPLVVATLSVGILITWMSNIIPLGLGIADGTNYALYDLLGASPEAGLVFTMINRVRTVVLAAMGLAILAVASALRRR